MMFLTVTVVILILFDFMPSPIQAMSVNSHGDLSILIEMGIREGTMTVPDDDLVSAVVKIWEEALETKPISSGDDFFDLGGDSLVALRVLDQVRERFGRDLPMTALLSASTPELLAEALLEAGVTASRRALVELSSGEGPPFFCMPGAGGSVFDYRKLALRLGGRLPFYGLQFHGTGRQSTIPHTVEDIAAHLAREVVNFYPQGPYLLGGYSFGGRVAYEMARRLKAEGRRVDLLALIDTWGAGFPGIASPHRRLVLHAREFLKRAPRARVEYLVQRASALAGRLGCHAREESEGTAASSGGESPSAFMARIREANGRASRRYRPRPYQGRITLLRAEVRPSWVGADFSDPYLGWGSLALGGVEVHSVPGDHLSLFEGPNIGRMATVLTSCLRSAVSRVESMAPSVTA
jgi:thioesterase domain-containing protein/acyl carrier protein